MDPEEIEARRRPPVAEEAGLDVRERQRRAQEGVVVEVDLPDREVVGGPLPGVDPVQRLGGERLVAGRHGWGHRDTSSQLNTSNSILSQGRGELLPRDLRLQL